MGLISEFSANNKQPHHDESPTIDLLVRDLPFRWASRLQREFVVWIAVPIDAFSVRPNGLKRYLEGEWQILISFHQVIVFPDCGMHFHLKAYSFHATAMGRWGGEREGELIFVS